jgi:hypothetical protein
MAVGTVGKRLHVLCRGPPISINPAIGTGLSLPRVTVSTTTAIGTGPEEWTQRIVV